MRMEIGTVKKLIRDKGYGFIARFGSDDLFFHRSALQYITIDELEEGERVEFELEQGPKGLRAVKVRLTV